MRALSFGSDPEFFLQEKGTVVPVCGWLGGTKEKHIPLGFFELHEDGIAAEITLPPTASMGSMIENVSYATSAAVDFVRSKKPTLGMHKASEVRIPTADLERAGPTAMSFGCSPEYDAYARGNSVPTINAFQLMRGPDSLRFAGGHIHLGYKSVRPEVAEYVVAMLCDLTLGLALVCNGERQPERRALYGQPGRFRPTPYGLEYRTPSNQWLFSGDLRHALIDGSERLREILHSSPEAIRAKWNSVNWVDVLSAIRSEDTSAAIELYGQL